MSNTPNTAMLEAALKYVARGWAVFPVAPGAKRPHPIAKNGVYDATTDVATIRSWWREFPEANIGIATGSVSGIVVLDVDKRHGGLETMDALLADGRLTATYSHSTAGDGYHFFFAHPGTPVKNRSGFMPGLDVKADGGYVVAPPSKFEGKGYKVCGDGNTPLANMPAFMAEPKAVEQPTPQTQAAADIDAGFRGTPRKPTLEFIAFGAAPGCWHDAFYRAAMDLKQNLFPYEEALELLSKPTGSLDETHDIPCLKDVYANRVPELPPNEPLYSGASLVPEGPASLSEPGATGSCVVIKAGSLAARTTRHLSDKELVNGEPFGFEPLDKLLGGNRLGEITVLQAEAKSGKNCLWHFLMHKQLSRGLPIGYASREMSPAEEVHPDLLSVEFKEDALRAEMTPERQAKYEAKLNEWHLYYAGYNGGYGYFPVEEFMKWMDECHASHGVRYFYLDHLHYALSSPDEWKEAVRFVHAIKPFVKTRGYNLQLIVQPSQLQEGQKLSLNSLKGGSHVGQTTDNILTLETVERNVRRVNLIKARSKLAEVGSFLLLYDPKTRSFAEAVEEPIAEPLTPYNSSPRPSWDGRGQRI